MVGDNITDYYCALNSNLKGFALVNTGIGENFKPALKNVKNNIIIRFIDNLLDFDLRKEFNIIAD